MRKIILMLLACISISFFLTACKKKVTTVHQNKIISVDTLPYNGAVATIICNNYVNKLFVDLLSREPDSAELQQNVQILKNNNFTDSAKNLIVQSLLNTHTFYEQFFLKQTGSMLNGTGKTDINAEIQFRNYLLNFYTQINDTTSYNYQLYELDKLKKLYTADSLFKLKQISINEFFKRILNNYFYENINMGSENYVKSCFENLFHRLPSQSELANGVTMVDGFSTANLFLQAGNNKGDFQNIVTSCTAFYEGQIVTAYYTYLLRKPTDTEISTYLTAFASNKNYLIILTNILKSKEYAGF